MIPYLIYSWSHLKERIEEDLSRCEEAHDYPDDIEIAPQVWKKTFGASDKNVSTFLAVERPVCKRTDIWTRGRTWE